MFLEINLSQNIKSDDISIYLVMIDTINEYLKTK